MVVHLSWGLQERGSGSTVSLTFGYSSFRRSTMVVTWVPEVAPPGPPLPQLAWELLPELLCEVIFPFSELSKYETPSLDFAFTLLLLLSAIWKKQSKRELLSPLLSLSYCAPLEINPSCSDTDSKLSSTLFFVKLFCFSTPSRSRSQADSIYSSFHSYNPLFLLPQFVQFSSRSLRKIFRMTTEKWRLDPNLFPFDYLFAD